MRRIDEDIELLDLICSSNSSKQERDKAWVLLLQDPYAFNFVYLVCHAPREEDQKRAWQELLKVTPQVARDNLCTIMNLAAETWKEKAWQQLLTQPHQDFDFVYIICCAPEQYKKKAWQELLKLKQNISLPNLYWIISCTSPRWQKLAWQKFLEQEPVPTDETLRKALSLTRSREIASYLLEKDTSEEEAVWNAAYVLEFCNSRELKEKAWHYLEQHPNKDVLLFLRYDKRLPLNSKYLKAVQQLLESLESLEKDTKDENQKSS